MSSPDIGKAVHVVTGNSDYRVPLSAGADPVRRRLPTVGAPRYRSIVTAVGPGEDGGALTPLERSRLLAFHYLAADESGQYVTIMRMLADDVGGLLSDWSAPEVAATLADRVGLVLDVDTVESRLRYLLDRGNLARSPRESEARSIREYLQVRSRYQVTPAGERVHRLVTEILGDPGGAQEISSELLPPLVAGLEALVRLVPDRIADTPSTELAERIATVFAQFDRLVESTRQFYAHLSELLQRVDVDREMFLTYKGALLTYLQTFVDDVRRHAPLASDLLDDLRPHLDDLCSRAWVGRGLAPAGVRRSRGLEPDDWDGLRQWFAGGTARRADADRVADLALDAIRALVATLNRLALPAGGAESRYSELLRLAGWFADADDQTAHDLWCATFGLFPPRHLGFPADPAVGIPATASFWSAPSADVPVSLRERGDRSAPGRSGVRRDFTDAKRRRLAERSRVEADRRAAAAELCELAGQAAPWSTSDAARTLLLELHAIAISDPSFLLTGAATIRDIGLGIDLTVLKAPGRSTTVASRSGRLVVHDLELKVQGVIVAADQAAEVTA